MKNSPNTIMALPCYLEKDIANLIYEMCQYLGLQYFQRWEKPADLPKELGPGVYIFFDNFGIPVYIGCSGELSDRIRRSHAKYENEEIITIGTFKVGKAELLETALVSIFQPRKNIVQTISGKKGRR